MAFVRKRGNQVAIVHGRRHPETRKVEQQTLFTFYSKAEALRALGRSGNDGAWQFHRLMETEHPAISFDWAKIDAGVESLLQALPDLAEYKRDRLQAEFRESLCRFTRQVVLADPQELMSSAGLLSEHRGELEYLCELIQWRLRAGAPTANEFNGDNEFYWFYAMRNKQVPPEVEEQAAEYYRRHEFDKAELIFGLLVDSFVDYAEGYNYLGLIAWQRNALQRAQAMFEKTVSVGRRLFPKRLAKKRYWIELSTRPYMRGLNNLAMVYTESGRYADALEICQRLERECGDGDSASEHRARIFLNQGDWRAAVDAATSLQQHQPEAGFLAALALFELGDLQQATECFLHAALNHPWAAQLLAGQPPGVPQTGEQVGDQNAIVALRRSCAAFFGEWRDESIDFFGDLIASPAVADRLQAIATLTGAWRAREATRSREAFRELQSMKSWQFAKTIAPLRGD